MAISSALGSSALLPAGLGFRNKIINGDFRVNQRAFSSSTTNATFGLDRWFFQTNTGTGTYSKQSFTVGSPAENGFEAENFARVVSASQTGTNAYLILCQKIEDVRTCAGATTVVSFYAKAASGTPKVAVELEQNFGSGGSPSSTVTNYLGQVTLSTSWQRFTLTFNVPSITGKTIGTTANTSFLQLNLWCSAGTDFNSRTGSLGVQNNTFDFWGVQVEQNYQPTPFEQRPIGVELGLCQRYYQRWQPYSYQYQSIGYTSGQGVGSAPSALPLSAYPRTFTTANVSLTFSSASHFECIANTGLATTATDISLNGLSPSAMSIRISGTFATNVPYEFRFNNTSAFLALSMEL
jgi:hypothetical protein